MAINVGTAEITVTADSRPFLPALQRQMRSVRKSASKMGASLGRRMGESLGKAFESAPSLRDLKPMNVKITALAAVLPLLTSAASAAAGGLTALTGSLLRAVSSAASAVGVMGALAQAAIVGKIAFGGLGDALGGDKEAFAALSPAGKELVNTLKSLSPAWKDFKDSIQTTALAGLSPVIRNLAGALLPVMKTELGGTARQLNLLLKSVGRFASSAKFVKTFGAAMRVNNGIFANLRKAAVPLLNGILHLYRALQPAAFRLSEGVAKVARSFSQWAEAGQKSGSIDRFMQKASESAKLLWRFVKNIAVALWNVTQIGAGAGDGLIKTFGDLAIRFRNFTESVSGRSAISDWIDTSVGALRTFGSVIMSMGGVFKALFNPKIFAGFMDLIETLTPTISKIAGTVQGALMPIIERVVEAFKKNGPKFAKLFEALAPLAKGVGSVIGEVVGQALDLLGSVAEFITPLIAKISSFIGPLLTKFAPTIAMIILLFTNWGSAIVKVVPIIGKLLAPLVKFAQMLLRAVGPAIVKIGGIVFKVFKFMAKIIIGGVKLWWKVISSVWKVIFKVFATILKAIWKVVSGAFKGYFKIVSSIFNAIRSVTGAVWGAVSKLISGAISTISRVIGGLKGVFATVKKWFNKIKDFISDIIKKKIAPVLLRIWDGLVSGLETAMNGIKAVINGVLSGVNRIIRGMNKIPKVDIPEIPELYKGTLFHQGGPALVGERGPELVNLPRGSKVKTAAETRRVREESSEGGTREMVYINKMMPHNYNEFERQMREQKRLAALGGRRPGPR